MASLWPTRTHVGVGKTWRLLTRSFDSHKYTQLPLITVEEFLSLHPEHADADENALMVARINHEKAEREKLEQQRQELVKRKSKLIADNKRRRDDLTNLDKDLEKFIDVRISHRYLCELLVLTNLQ